MTVPFIELKNVSKTFPGVKALDKVHLDILPGEVHSLVGENGAGKSTVIKIMTGAYTPDDGSVILIDGEEVVFNDVIDSIKKGISVIYQDFSLFGNLTVAENICINQMIEKKQKILNWSEIKKEAQRALDLVGSDLDTMELVENLSVARQQIVALASAIAQDARLIIMDEPTSALSKSEIDNLFTIIDDLRNKGISVLFVSHKLDEVFRVSDRITTFRDGQFISTDKVDEVDRSGLISKMVGRDIMINDYTNCIERENVVLEVENLSLKGNYKDISFKLYEGEILGITGLVGAGRSELVESLFGISQPDSGTIKVKNEAVTIRDTKDALKNGIGLVPEDRKIKGLVQDYNLADNMTLPVLSRYAKNGLVNQDEKNERVDELMELMDVRPNNSELLATQLSGGNQQKVVIAKWINANGSILITDEPTNGVDIGAKTEIYRILRELADEGLSIIVVSSELPEILSISDRVLVMRRGRISGEFINQGLTQEMIMDKAVVSG